MAKLEVIEGLLEQTSSERIGYTVDFTGYGAGTLDSATVVAYDEVDGSDVTSTGGSTGNGVFPTATVGVDGAVATLSVLRDLVKGHTYRMEVLAIESTAYYETYFRVYCSK